MPIATLLPLEALEIGSVFPPNLGVRDGLRNEFAFTQFFVVFVESRYFDIAGWRDVGAYAQ